jgi:hypothetical protein
MPIQVFFPTPQLSSPTDMVQIASSAVDSIESQTLFQGPSLGASEHSLERRKGEYQA